MRILLDIIQGGGTVTTLSFLLPITTGRLPSTLLTTRGNRTSTMAIRTTTTRRTTTMLVALGAC